jgi:hypothetical protein
MAWTVIAKNSSGSTVVLSNLGTEILNGTQLTLSDYYEYSDLTDDKELENFISNGDLVINDGTNDLSATEGVNYLSRDNIYNDLTNHYTKTELTTPNTGNLVDWSNIANVPSFGSPQWVEPILYRVETISASGPTSSSTGDVYVDTDDNHYYKWDGSSWADQGSASSNDRVINLADTTEDIYTFDGSSWSDGGTSNDNTAVMVNDDGDGKNSQYVYSTESSNWIKIADVDFDDHLDGGASKHDASEIDVEGSYSNFSSSPGDLESVISDINTQMTEALDNNTLDGAYDEGGAGVGRTINADAGAVVIDSGVATTAPFQLTPKGSLPTTGLLDGQLAIKDGLLYIYDSTRTKWLSVHREILVFGRRRSVRNQYLNFAVGNLSSNNSGYRIPRNATIVAMTGQLDANGTCDMRVRRNDVATNIATLTITSANGAIDVSTNIDVNANDFLQSYLSASSSVQDPVFMVELAWRE